MKEHLSLLFTCEHGGNRVPARLQAAFRGWERVVASHRGWDPGALDLARFLSRRLEAPLVASTMSRLVVDLNRSANHPRLFSAVTRALPLPQREYLLREIYLPFRGSVLSLLKKNGPWLHLSVHSFTPVWMGKKRSTDLGVLYDPRRPQEARMGALFARELRGSLPDLRVHRNRPYRGQSDGHTTALRKRLAPEAYSGLELEINQRLLRPGRKGARVRAHGSHWQALRLGVGKALEGTLRSAGSADPDFGIDRWDNTDGISAPFPGSRQSRRVNID